MWRRERKNKEMSNNKIQQGHEDRSFQRMKTPKVKTEEELE